MSEIIQGSPEWHALRAGKVTASRIADVVARTAKGWGASRDDYAGEIISERLTGLPREGFTNAAMQWGTDTEPKARRAYEWEECCTVDQVGFVAHPTIAMSGASPDGLVGVDGLVEIKCPKTHTHIETLRGGAIANKYLLQMQWQMACTGRLWTDFVSFDPRMPLHMQFHRRRVNRDDKLIASLEADVTAFLAEIDETVAELSRLYPAPDDTAVELSMAG